MDELANDYLKMREMRTDTKALDEAVAIATAEQHIRKRFSLRAGYENDRPQ